MLIKMEYCNPNVTLFTWWYNNGISHCFLNTFTSIFFILYVVPFGLWKLFMYKIHGTAVCQSLKSHSRLYDTQIFLHYVRILSPIFWLFWQFWSGDLYGHIFVKHLSEMVVWSFSLILIKFRRSYKWPSYVDGYSLAMILFWAIEFLIDNLSLINLFGLNLHYHEDQIKLGIYCERYFCLLAILVIGIKAPGLPISVQQKDSDNTENDKSETTSEEPAKQVNFRKTWKNFRQLLPHLWPKNSLKVQTCILVCVLTFIADRFFNLYLPIYNKWIIDSLSAKDGENQNLSYRWDFILLYVAIEFGQTCMQYVNRNFLWDRIEQFMTREIQVYLYTHLHGLSLRWHLSRKTGEVLKVMDRGASSINSVLTDVILDIAPAVIDLTIAIVFFSSYFNIWLGLTVVLTILLYLVVTYYSTMYRRKYYKKLNDADNDFETKAVDALLNFETVKYYNAEEYEINRYRDSMLKSQLARRSLMRNISAVGLVENFITNAGEFAGSLLCAWFIVQNWEGFTVGTYVLFGSYIARLYRPIYWLARCYKDLQKSFINIDSMFEILNQDQEVKDEIDAPPLEVKRGKIEFRNVSFNYTPEKTTLKNISFVVEPGKTLALVGPSGSGKSTIIRLIFRFYDVQSGTILIDDQDISKTSQKSLRDCIGVVPQDTVLFNDSVKYNIKYGKITAADEEVFAAALAAEIHDKILSFPEGYDAKVGERGLMLSGGEKQRVAIARTILKAPNFVLLDEATSALDTQTERLIQASLDEICVGRTTIVVAHRLSTIIDADEILVIKDGEIVERGNQQELLDQNGLYADMWRQQLEKPISKSSSTNSLQSLKKQDVPRLKLSPLVN